MSATDELRRMLDERGVEYETRDGDTVKNTYWSCNGLRWGYTEDVDYSGMIDPMLFPMVGGQLTFAPEQAIAATLGAGTCKNKATSLRTFWCDCCDCALEDWMDVGGKLVNGLRYCPNCGRKVDA